MAGKKPNSGTPKDMRIAANKKAMPFGGKKATPFKKK